MNQVQGPVELGAEDAIEDVHRLVADQLVLDEPRTVDQTHGLPEAPTPLLQHAGEVFGVADVDLGILDAGAHRTHPVQVLMHLARPPQRLIGPLELGRRDRAARPAEPLVEPGLHLGGPIQAVQPVVFAIRRRGRRADQEQGGLPSPGHLDGDQRGDPAGAAGDHDRLSGGQRETAGLIAERRGGRS